VFVAKKLFILQVLKKLRALLLIQSEKILCASVGMALQVSQTTAWMRSCQGQDVKLVQILLLKYLRIFLIFLVTCERMFASKLSNVLVTYTT